MEQSELLYLLEGKHERPALVHGTCVEAVLTMLNTGRLPSGQKGETKDYLYFVPRKDAFKSHPLYPSIPLENEGQKLERKVEGYARHVQQKSYLTSLFGISKGVIWDFYFASMTLESSDEGNINRLPKKIRAKLERYGIEKLFAELSILRGVILGLSDKVSELAIEPDKESHHDGDGYVQIHLPDGLDIKYLSYIYPCGDLEEKILYDYLRNLKRKTVPN